MRDCSESEPIVPELAEPWKSVATWHHETRDTVSRSYWLGLFEERIDAFSNRPMP